MKTLWPMIFCMAMLAPFARAEPQYLSYQKLSSEEKSSWGFKIEQPVDPLGDHARFKLVIPPAKAKYFDRTGLSIKDRRGEIVAESITALASERDGSLSVEVELYRHSTAELIIYSRAGTEMLFPPDVSGFRFIIAAKP